MRLVRFRSAGRFGWGSLEGDTIVRMDGSFASGFAPSGGTLRVAEVQLVAPVVPSKIVCVATNYPAHAAEMGRSVPDEPRIFLKPPSAVIGPGDAIRIPPRTMRIDPEPELGIVMGPSRSIFGYTCVNDVTARDFQKKDGIFGRAKGFDTFCPLGPCVVTGLDPGDLEVGVRVDGEVRAVGRTRDMHFDVAALLAFIGGIMTLEPGDVIATGTPPGVAPIVTGNRVQVWVEGIGTLENPVVDREDR